MHALSCSVLRSTNLLKVSKVAPLLKIYIYNDEQKNETKSSCYVRTLDVQTFFFIHFTRVRLSIDLHPLFHFKWKSLLRPHFDSDLSFSNLFSSTHCHRPHAHFARFFFFLLKWALQHVKRIRDLCVRCGQYPLTFSDWSRCCRTKPCFRSFNWFD